MTLNPSNAQAYSELGQTLSLSGHPDDGIAQLEEALRLAPAGESAWSAEAGLAIAHFMAGRGAHEKAYGELKSGFAFDCVPTHSYQANSAWQIFCLLAFNLTRGFQAATIAAPRRQNRKRRTTRRFLSIHTLRFRLLNRAGLIVSPNGRPTLDVGTAPDVRRNFEKSESALPNAA